MSVHTEWKSNYHINIRLSINDIVKMEPSLSESDSIMVLGLLQRMDNSLYAGIVKKAVESLKYSGVIK